MGKNGKHLHKSFAIIGRIHKTYHQEPIVSTYAAILSPWHKLNQIQYIYAHICAVKGPITSRPPTHSIFRSTFHLQAVMQSFTSELDTLCYPALHNLTFIAENHQNNTLLHRIAKNRDKGKWFTAFPKEHDSIEGFELIKNVNPPNLVGFDTEYN